MTVKLFGYYQPRNASMPEHVGDARRMSPDDHKQPQQLQNTAVAAIVAAVAGHTKPGPGQNRFACVSSMESLKNIYGSS